jgi:dihydroflavonol-4-reductase
MILVTGGTGFVGSHLLYELCRQGKKVRALCRSTKSIEKTKHIFAFYTPDPEILIASIEWVNADLLNYSDIIESLDNIDQIYHCAAQVSFSSGDKNEMLRFNTEVTRNIVEAALEKGNIRLCHVSSIAALGSSENGEAVTEKHFWKSTKGQFGYSRSKYESEMEIWRGIAEGLNAVIVNPSFILGPGPWENGSPSLIARVAKGTPFYTSGINGYVDVRDVALAMIKLMDSGICEERFVLNAANLSYKELFEEIALAAGEKAPKFQASPALLKFAVYVEWIRNGLLFRKPQLTSEAIRAAQNKRTYDSQKIKDTLGFEFRPIKESIREITTMYLNSTAGLKKK